MAVAVVGGNSGQGWVVPGSGNDRRGCTGYSCGGGRRTNPSGGMVEGNNEEKTLALDIVGRALRSGSTR